MDPWTCHDPGRQLLKGLAPHPEQNSRTSKKHLVTLRDNVSHETRSGLDALIVSLPSNEQWLRIINFKSVLISKKKKEENPGRCSRGIKNNNFRVCKTYMQISNPEHILFPP